MFKTSLIYFLIRAVNGVLALSTIYILTRILSAEQYGLYALGIAGIGLCASVLFQWIAVAASRFYAAHLVEPDILLTEAYRLFFRVAAAAMLIAGIYAAWLPVPAVTPVLVLSVGVGTVAMGLHNLGVQVANARDQPFRYGLLTASRGALALLGAVLFVQAGFGGVGAVLGVALACVLSVIFFGARRQTNARPNSPELRRQMVVYGLPLTLTYLATMVLDVSDRFMIGWWLGPSAVAGYAASYDLAQQTVGVALNVFFLASYPRITAAWEAGGAPAARQAMQPLSRAMLLGAPLVVGIFIGLADDISQVFFGEAVRTDAARVMPWVAFAIAVGCLKSYFLDVAFQLAKVTHMQLRITVVMAVLNVVLNLILLPKFGVVGAAVATAAAFLLGAVMSWWFGRRLGVYSAGKRDVLSMMAALLAIVLVLHFAPTGIDDGLFDVAFRLLAGLVGYAVAVLLTNLADVRSGLMYTLRTMFIKGVE